MIFYILAFIGVLALVLKGISVCGDERYSEEFGDEHIKE